MYKLCQIGRPILSHYAFNIFKQSLCPAAAISDLSIWLVYETLFYYV